MKQLIIFDWDGTLCDSLARIAECVRAAATDVGVALPEVGEVKEVVGLGLLEAFQQLYPLAESDQLDFLKESYSQHFVEKDRRPSPFYEGVEEVLGRLKSRGLLLAVATGKSRRGLDRVLEARGMTGFFHGSRCADETLSKPHPLMLHQLLEEFCLPVGKSVMVGDTEFDMAMAENVNMPRIAVSYGAHDIGRLKKYQPLRCADDFFQVERSILEFVEG